MFRSERIRRVVLFKSFCFWGCVCLGRREYVELGCVVQILLFLGLCVCVCVFRSERIRRVGLCCSNPSVSGVVCVFRSERIRRVVLLKSFCFWGCVCLGRREYVELCCSNPSVSGVVCV